MRARKVSIMLLIAAAVVSGFNALMVRTVFSPCPPPAMKCVATTDVITALMAAACLILAVSAVLSVRKKYKASSIVLLLGALCTLGAILMPSIMGGCMKADMRCRVYTFPYVYAASTVCLILQLVASVAVGKSVANEDGE